ncbi:MAG: polysaccharide deacetylase family protein [Acidobacteriota bacterium]
MAWIHKIFGMQPLEPEKRRKGLYQPVPGSDLQAILERRHAQPRETPPAPKVESAIPVPEGAPVLGLRIDVDTHDGMRDGVPALLSVLNEYGIKGTFYLALGPDKSGRAVFNMLKPGFLVKMFRTRAASMYGWRTILSGTILPPRPVATGFPEIARRIREEGHETGVHSWDHRSWQDKLLKWRDTKVAREMENAFQAYKQIFGEPPHTFASPAWLCRNESLLYQEKLGLLYASDCRGQDPFFPVIDIRVLNTAQVPATLPTLDEALGETHQDAGGFYESILDQVKPGEWPVLTIHAEIEGGPYRSEFGAFLRKAAQRHIVLMPLRDLLAHRLASKPPLPHCTMSYAAVEGRHGVVSMQTMEV